MLEDKIQNPSECLFRFTLVSNVMDKRSGMVDSVEDFQSSRSIAGKNFPNFEMLDAKVASALNKIIQNSHFKKKVSLEEQKAQKEDRCLRGRQITFVIFDYFRVTGAHDTVLDYADLFSITLRDDNVQEFDPRWDELFISDDKIPSDEILESLYKLRIRESDQLRFVLDSSEINDAQLSEIENDGEEKHFSEIQIAKFDARNERIETGAVVTNRSGQRGVERGQGECYQWKTKGQCSRGDKCSFQQEGHERAKPTPKTAPSSERPTQRGRSASRKRSLRVRSQSGKFARQPCRDYLKGTCTKSPCDYWHPPECQFHKSESGCKFGDKCSCAHRQVEGQPSKKQTRMVTEVQWLF